MADGGKSLRDIGARLVALMEATNHKSQVGFAQLIEVSQPALNNYLKGLRRPELDVAMRIQARTGATLDWIYLGERSGLPAKLSETLPDLSSKRAG
ncbi:XRE family transcriptional regulator [Mesorhizobium sp. M2D.F.Ca.ET.185.01.1.1]|uniref:helix-turn-helix domain-containing protein n=1 Tax=unclassified Mesorhizobium TaxID=325217 RepID=UPI000FD8140F|nr:MULTISPECIES: helix-turn-helix transcriptional regulator [unclassified Mesorhizobium]TGV74475.1 XRE family transcriptional regulator [Mesorhizobium sp. M00.F.Ca.ET.149.01.1.1]TGW04857.1 XRE family transcriptional regulator [Mesorhizobium sp. M2D.F.Ca.ET.145.01.1.1]TGQ89432.1 XRE family transcriptional regulator [Mesorhizobium sp. M2D.F.Ca.ET.206.01.1.1]TGS32597.1 XRE family transcriptional regulator [Mesorhizobium sp. M2D.F.Ca.ET.185.01.1.1]TGU23687.1 XRE family transcriptional regulator [M